jgi:hypothetical protein
VVLATFALPAVAAAQAPDPTGGVAPTAAPVAAPAAPLPRPVVEAVVCRTLCRGIRRAVPGSVVRVSGEGMGAVGAVVLLGRRGRADDVTVPATPVSPTAAEVVVPRGARGGPVRALSSAGPRSLASDRLVVLRARARDSGGPPVEARVETRRLLFAGGRTATVDFYVRGPTGVDAAVDVVRASDRIAVAHFDVPAVAPGTVQSVSWDGTSGGVAQPEGRYVFQVSTHAGPGGAQAAGTAAGAQSRQSFWIAHGVYPVAGPHTYGDGFGVLRGNRIHEGQDVLAACGTPLVAVHGGAVKAVGAQALAGNYVVLSADDGSGDQVYMHLRDPALVATGDPVVMGQTIGVVGETGDATACHLHFELWPAPGWSTGGQPVDPLPSLQAWDVGG